MANDIPALVARLQNRFSALKPNSPELHAAYTRIGMFVQAQARLTMRAKGMIDTGRLINSIQYQFYKEGDIEGLRVGSFGVPYAAIHEFGGPFTAAMRRAMFASMARRNRVYKNKKVIVGGHVRARPYLRPAFARVAPMAIDLLRDALKLEG